MTLPHLRSHSKPLAIEDDTRLSSRSLKTAGECPHELTEGMPPGYTASDVLDATERPAWQGGTTQSRGQPGVARQAALARRTRGDPIRVS